MSDILKVSEVPEVPEVSEDPEGSEVQKASEIPDFPTEFPTIPGAGEVPGIPEA